MAFIASYDGPEEHSDQEYVIVTGADSAPVPGMLKWMMRVSDHGHVQVRIVDPKGIRIDTCIEPEIVRNISNMFWRYANQAEDSDRTRD